MVGVAQLVRVPDCGSEGRGFESLLPPFKKNQREVQMNISFFIPSILHHPPTKHNSPKNKPQTKPIPTSPTIKIKQLLKYVLIKIYFK